MKNSPTQSLTATAFPCPKVARAGGLFAGFGILLLLAGCDKKEAPPAPGPPEVLVAQVAEQNVPIFNDWVAQLNGPVNADITPKVQDYLLRQHYQNVYFVKKGQLLFELDPRQYQAAVDQAKAALDRTQANVDRFQNDVTRDTPLAAQNAIPLKQLDNDVASLNAAKAQILADKAELENAQLNLAWTKVNSPIDGIAGDAKSQIGDLVGTTNKMTTISQVNPICAYFNISKSAYLENAAKISAVIRQGKSASVAVRYIQANGEEYPYLGRLIQVNRQVTAGTGTIRLTAEFPNPNAILRPGGFGSVRIQTADNPNALLVPQAAVIEVQSMYQVIVVSPDNKATFRPVKLGDRVGPNWIITEGLKPGERVVVEGIQRIQQAAAAAPRCRQPPEQATGQPMSIHLHSDRPIDRRSHDIAYRLKSLYFVASDTFSAISCVVSRAGEPSSRDERRLDRRSASS